MYIALACFPASFAVAFDSAWLLGATALTFLYTDLVVVKAEEKFLKEELGQPYVAYCEKIPRWPLGRPTSKAAGKGS